MSMLIASSATPAERTQYLAKQCIELKLELWQKLATLEAVLAVPGIDTEDTLDQLCSGIGEPISENLEKAAESFIELLNLTK